MSKKIDLFTRDKILQSLHLSNEKVAQLCGVKPSTVARIRSYQPMESAPREVSDEPYNPTDNTAQIIAASGRLRDAVRVVVNDYARRMGQPPPDWAAMDERVVQ